MNPDALDPKYRAGFDAGASTSEAALSGARRLLDKAEARIIELEAALRDLSGDAFYLRHASDMHDVGAMERFIQSFAKSKLNN